MRVLLLTQLFQPEPNHLKGLAFARELRRRGVDVEVLTGFPNYPGGHIYPGYRVRWRQREVIDDIPIERVPLYPSHSRSGPGRMACYGSFAATATLLAAGRIRRPDLIHVYQGPATLSLPARVLARRFGSASVLDVQDLWPDSVAASGMLRSRVANRLISSWCRRTYRWATRIVVLSEGYKAALIARGVPAAKIEVVYNWSDERESAAEPTGPAAPDTWSLAGGFNVVYAGNMGPLQALDSVLRAASELKTTRPSVRFVFVGDGVDAARLQAAAAHQRLDNVVFLPRQPAERMRTVFAHADALLIHLRDDPLCRIGIPQKTQAYLAAGIPIVMAVRGNAADLVRRAGAAVFAEPQDPTSLARAIERLHEMRPEERQALGHNGRDFYVRELSFAVGVERMLAVFRSAIASLPAHRPMR